MPPSGAPRCTSRQAFLEEALVRKLTDTIVDAGFFRIPLSKHTFETGHRVEHPQGSGQWFIGESWNWVDPEGYLCETEPCRQAMKKLQLWGTPALPEDFPPGRPWILLGIAQDNAVIAWPYDQLDEKTKK
jgi:hypothetical protein